MVVGIDDSEHSTYALQWTLDHFFANSTVNPPFKLVIVHARPSPSAVIGLAGHGAVEVLPHVDSDLKKIAARLVEEAKEICSSKSGWQKSPRGWVPSGIFPIRGGSSTRSTGDSYKKATKWMTGFNDYVNNGDCAVVADELDSYLDEKVISRMEDFNILSWWKTNANRYPTLARIARDILAIPITTVASESAFNTSGRVVHDAVVEVVEGDARNILCDAVEKHHASILVVGSHGYGAIKRAVLGSVSDYCAHHAHCTVMIVKRPKTKH
ncbi:Usp domain-containing protein [Citrus sinensis]|nr:Usp domain-containing protein [Citrus sinensis]